MGTFGNYYGPAIIKEDRIDAFTLGISKILFYGGMMHLRNVEMYGKQILLLDPVVLKKGEDVDFTYNYFEERSWENAGYESNNHIFYSDKIGSHEFNLVVTAVYCLYELFDEGRGFAMVNGDIVQNPMYIGWINHLLKTEYTFAKRYAIWANVEEYAVERRDYDRPFSQSDLFDIVPKYLIKYAGGTELADVLYVIFGTETLEAADVIEGTYPFDILKCKNAIKRAIDFYGKKKAYDYISEIARMNSEGRRSIVNKYLNSIAECSLYMPARVLVYLMK